MVFYAANRRRFTAFCAAKTPRPARLYWSTGYASVISVVFIGRAWSPVQGTTKFKTKQAASNSAASRARHLFHLSNRLQAILQPLEFQKLQRERELQRLQNSRGYSSAPFIARSVSNERAGSHVWPMRSDALKASHADEHCVRTQHTPHAFEPAVDAGWRVVFNNMDIIIETGYIDIII